MTPFDIQQSVFLKACRREPVPYTPVWLMRQAGRYQASYRAVRSKVGFLDMCKNSDLAAQVTVAAVNELGVDAGIIFADILLLLEPMGVPIEFTAGDGPQILKKVGSRQDVDALRAEIDATADLGYVLEAIKKFKNELPKTPIIGFAASPFTLASYAIEGGGSKNYSATKKMMLGDPGMWSELMQKISVATTRYLNAQIEAGAHAIQIFDSWVGALTPEDYRESVLPHVKNIVQGLKPNIPVIVFGTGTSGYLEDLADSGAHVVGVDWRIEMNKACKRLPNVAVQGNFDPSILLAPPNVVADRARALIDSMGDRRDWVFNLGHGLLPEIPEENVRLLVKTVHEHSARSLCRHEKLRSSALVFLGSPLPLD